MNGRCIILYKILLVDDEIHIVDMLKDYFEINDYNILTAYDGEEAIEKLKFNPDLIILDINMPKINGLDLCKKVREYVNVPILFLTARVSEKDRVKGFMVGADDYIIKPFSLEELGARVYAHLRRENRRIGISNIKFQGDLVINYSTRTVNLGEEIYLTKTEFDILELLSMNSGQIFSKEGIYDSIWGFDGVGDSSVVAEHIRRIRDKLRKQSSYEYINTVWGAGYKWNG